MMHFFSATHWIMALAFISMPFAACSAQAADSATVKALFADPPVEYSSCPLWVWNDMLTEQQIISTLHDLAAQEIKQAFIHPRPGLMTPYLSDDWFRLWKVALKEAERLDMNLWIYDENSYPSGFAGGFVPQAMPDSRGKGLQVREQKLPPQLSDDIVAVYQINNDRCENVTEKIRSGEKLPDSQYLVASVTHADNAPWYGGKYYVDLLHPGVTEKFLEVTMDPYHRQLGSHFGKRLPGVFTDEPHLAPNWDNHWTDDLPELFEKRWGYSLNEHLPSLFKPVGDWKRLRHNYFQLLLELFIERWAKPYYDYCEREGLEFTGHYWEHEWPNCKTVPDNMAMAAFQQTPGIDILMNQYREDTHAQFGNIRSVKELSSVANQLNRKRTLCEAYGAGGWDLRFEDIKRIGDWLYVLGVNMLNEHLSYVTIRGARKRDHPQSFSYHEPWWQQYHLMVRYFTRLSAVLSQGRQINNILLIEPTTTVWMYQPDPQHKENLNKIGEEFQKMVVALAKAQIEYDLGSEDIIARHASVHRDSLKVGHRQYETIILPPLTENLNAKTMALIESYTKNGGKVFCCGPPPTLVDGRPSTRGSDVSQNSSWNQIEPAELPATLLNQSKGDFAIHHNTNDNDLLFHHRRQLQDGQILFLVNTSIDSPCIGEIESKTRAVEHWDLQTGDISPYPFTISPNGIKTNFELPPCGSLLLFLSDRHAEPIPPESKEISQIASSGPLHIKRIAPNVLTLDYVDVTAKNKTKEKSYFYHASQFVFEQNGMEHNPWDNAVQFRDELITTKFPPDSGFEAAYQFKIEDTVPKPLYIVIERPDLYTITCNGKSLQPDVSSWWLDKAFGKLDITSTAKIGDNVVTITAAPMTIYHELESAYLLGSFNLKNAESGFVVTPQAPLNLGPWNKQGSPFYAAGASYTQDFDLKQLSGRYYVKLTDWYGSVAKVIVNGKTAGHIYHQPWQCDITESLNEGLNTIEVVVIGTLKNTLGPHHENSPRGSAWPGMFQKAPQTGPPPGENYDTIGYGLFKNFKLYKQQREI